MTATIEVPTVKKSSELHLQVVKKDVQNIVLPEAMSKQLKSDSLSMILPFPGEGGRLASLAQNPEIHID